MEGITGLLLQVEEGLGKRTQSEEETLVGTEEKSIKAQLAFSWRIISH